jgi:hypothetical protein
MASNKPEIYNRTPLDSLYTTIDYSSVRCQQRDDFTRVHAMRTVTLSVTVRELAFLPCRYKGSAKIIYIAEQLC